MMGAMRWIWFVVAMLAAQPVAARPPTGYACAPGTVNRGVGCTCPKAYRDRQDGEGTAICVTAPSPNVSAQFVAAVAKGDLATAKTLVTKYDFVNEKKALEALAKSFTAWVKPAKDQATLAASRGQCKAVSDLLGRGHQYLNVFMAIGNRLDKKANSDPNGTTIGDTIGDQVAEHLDPISDEYSNCIKTASKDDGTSQLSAARDANQAALAKCFIGVPDPKTPLSAKVVIDAEGSVAEVQITVTWPDLDLQLVNWKLEMTRLQEIAMREKCFYDAIGSWKFKPNARGFAGTIAIKR
jgi:hypothetical protein